MKGEVSEWFDSVSRVNNHIDEKWLLAEWSKKQEERNSMFWFLASIESGEWYISLLCYFFFSRFPTAMPPIIPHNLSFANKQLLKVFLCFANRRNQISIAGTAKNRQLMQKLFEYFFRLHKLCIHALIQ